ncbi:MAG: (Fe-S)-binding protein [Candidatus Krumholzibacteriota bacterium]|nr:(Fe-S)-binding protein [Candidatus Krumholzibacteriota bacterium]
MNREQKRDITVDFLRCNRCGACKAVCPVFEINREEWSSARGKVELAEAFFRGDDIGWKDVRRVYDLCLQCRACQENCPSGMRADDIIMAVRYRLAENGLLPRSKRAALKLLESMDNLLFKFLRFFRLSRRGPLHGAAGRSPLSLFFPLLGWPRQRFFPLPADRPFLGRGREFFPAREVESSGLKDESQAQTTGAGKDEGERKKAADLMEMITRAREHNLREGKSAYFFIGHAVNQFFPEEARALVRVLNILGIDVSVPADQICCGAPFYYAGDVAGARRQAAGSIGRISRHRTDWIVTSCASGGLMLKEEMSRLFNIHGEGFFDFSYDPETEIFEGKPEEVDEKYRHIPGLYREHIEGKVRDINELLAEVLGLQDERGEFEDLFQGRGEAPAARESITAERELDQTIGREDLPVVTYHHPCHLNRGQDVNWQAEKILEILPGYRYLRMKDADRCCGGGGAFTFTHADLAQRIAERKVDCIAEINPDMVATSCPVCRIQLVDMLRRRFVLEAKARGEAAREIPVCSPVELLAGEIDRLSGSR